MFSTDSRHVADSHRAPRVYYLVWRTRPNRPWLSEELHSRSEAHNRYFALIQRGYEAYLEKRQTAALPA